MTPTTARDTRWTAIRAGLSRGRIETRQSFSEVANVIGHLIPAATYLGVLLMLRGKNVPGTDFPLTTMVLPSLLSLTVILGGIAGPTTALVADREDGTLLRAKATPNGMLGYLIGKIMMFTLTTLVGFAAIVVLGVTLIDELTLDVGRCLQLALLFVGGLLATVPIGVALDSVMKTTVQATLVPFVCALLLFPSGIFYPIAVLPTWLQWVGQAFPFYWVGLGARSAMLPAEMATVEIGQSWRTGETFLMLGGWALAGLVLAPPLLRRMARRQSGSAMAAVRERYLSKGY